MKIMTGHFVDYICSYFNLFYRKDAGVAQRCMSNYRYAPKAATAVMSWAL